MMTDGIPEGSCPGCGEWYRGWALREPQQQVCPRCGIFLDMKGKENSDSILSRPALPSNVN